MKRKDKNCHIPNLAQAFPYIENCGLNLILWLANPKIISYSKQALLANF